MRTGLVAGIFTAALASAALTSPIEANESPIEANELTESGLVTKPSQHSVQETIEQFENAVKAKGWVIFTEINHAAAARQAGLEMRARTVILFGAPKIGTAPMQRAATLAIDNPPKALVWEVWLTYNSGAFIGTQTYPRHGLSMPPELIQNIDRFLDQVSDAATK
jgi:uncharacterized protein (DUF302 family)